MSGVVVHDLTQYPRAARPAVSRAFSLGQGLGIVGIIPGSGAERAGLRIDDEIVSIGGRSVEDASVWIQPASSYDRVDRFNALLSASLADGATAIQIRRQSQLLQITLTGQPGCGGILKLVDSSSINAWSDGRHVVLNAGIVRMARNDDEIAFVIAHEMAHNILGHIANSANTSRMLFGRIFGASAPRDAESQADAAGVSLMREGGYEPQGAVQFLETARRKMWWAVSFDHPGFGSRLRTVSMAIANHPIGFGPVATADPAVKMDPTKQAG
jgi:S1-C subfamily serine protease